MIEHEHDSIAENETIEKPEEICQAIKTAFYSSTTLRRLDFDKLPDSYLPSIIYAFLVNVSILIVKTCVYLYHYGFERYINIPSKGLNFLLKFIIILFGGFIVTCVGGCIVEFKKAPKYSLLFVSSLTCSCILEFCRLFPLISNFARFWLRILIGCYFWMSLSQAAEYSEKMFFIIHWGCNLLVYFAVEIFMLIIDVIFFI